MQLFLKLNAIENQPTSDRWNLRSFSSSQIIPPTPELNPKRKDHIKPRHVYLVLAAMRMVYIVREASCRR